MHPEAIVGKAISNAIHNLEKNPANLITRGGFPRRRIKGKSQSKPSGNYCSAGNPLSWSARLAAFDCGSSSNAFLREATAAWSSPKAISLGGTNARAYTQLGLSLLALGEKQAAAEPRPDPNINRDAVDQLVSRLASVNERIDSLEKRIADLEGE